MQIDIHIDVKECQIVSFQISLYCRRDHDIRISEYYALLMLYAWISLKFNTCSAHFERHLQRRGEGMGKMNGSSEYACVCLQTSALNIKLAIISQLNP